MIDGLQPYPEYKESGLSWLGRVPSDWSVRRIKTVLVELDRRSADGSGTLLSLTRVRGLIPHQEMTDKMHSAKTLAGFKRVAPEHAVGMELKEPFLTALELFQHRETLP